MDERIEVNGQTHVIESSIRKETPRLAEPKGKMQYCIVRTYSAGVFAGYVAKEKGKKAIFLMVISMPEEQAQNDLAALFSPCTEKAKENIAKVAIWAV